MNFNKPTSSPSSQGALAPEYEPWEYQLIELAPGTFNARKGYEKSLNREGEDGWELVTLFQQAPDKCLAAFKRRPRESQTGSAT